MIVNYVIVKVINVKKFSFLQGICISVQGFSFFSPTVKSVVIKYFKV